MRKLKSSIALPKKAETVGFFERAKSRCEYCLLSSHLTNAPMHCEHILPKSKGVKSSPENLALACAWCNGFKGTKTHTQDLKTVKLVRIFNPRKDHWEKYFRWSKDLNEIKRLTAIGRATVEALKLIRKELVWLPTLLVAIREYPKQK